MWDLLTGVSWTIIGLIIAVFIALLGFAFPLTAKGINKHNQKIAVTILSVLLVVFIICLLVQLSVEYRKINIDESTSKSTSSSESNSISESESESKSNTSEKQLPQIDIEDVYENAFVANGLFGRFNYPEDRFFKYDNSVEYYEEFKKSQINCEMCDVELIFESTDDVSFINCRLSIAVPAAHDDSSTSYIDFDFNNNDVFSFQKGLYKFCLETPDGKAYYSDFLYIGKNGTKVIEMVRGLN